MASHSNDKKIEASWMIESSVKDRKSTPYLNFVSTPDHIRYCIRSLLLTQKEERVFHPEIGSELRSFFFRQYQPTLVQELKKEIERVIQTHEPRVSIYSIDVQRDQQNLQLLRIFLTYRILSTGQMDSLQMAMNSG